MEAVQILEVIRRRARLTALELSMASTLGIDTGFIHGGRSRLV